MPANLEPGTIAYAAVDVGAREDIAKIEERLKAVDDLLMDISHSYWGDRLKRDNGVKSRVERHSVAIRGLVNWANKAEQKNREYLQSYRAKTCIGKEALEKHLKEHDTMSAQEFALEVARIQAATEAEKIKVEKGKYKWKEVAVIIGAVLVLATQVINTAQTAALERELHGSRTEASK